MTLQDRLDFVLPDFTRVAWVSTAAESTWRPRIDQIRAAWAEVEWRSVAAGVREAHLTRVRPEQLPTLAAVVAKKGLAVLPLALEGQRATSYSSVPSPYEPGAPFVYAAAVGRTGTLTGFGEAWAEGDHQAIGSALGFPPCCRDFFQRVWIAGRHIDTTWAMAEATPDARRPEPRLIEIEEAGLSSPILRWLGVRLVPHLPCRFGCTSSEALGADLRAVGVDEGFAQAMEWTTHMLQWSAEWDARHGIAEIRCPAAKIVTRTDATAETHRVRVYGESEAVEGSATGLRFPYRTNPGRALTRSSSFQRGLANTPTAPPLPDQRIPPANGFNTYRAMELAHEPLVRAIREELRDARGVLLDLGAGSGFLVHKACAEVDGLEAGGIEIDPQRLTLATELVDEPARFGRGDLFDVSSWPVEPDNLAATILMIGRLTEVEVSEAGNLIEALRGIGAPVFLYAYDRTHREQFDDLAAHFGLVVDVVHDKAPTTVGVWRPRAMDSTC